MIGIPTDSVRDAANIHRDMFNIKRASPYFYNWLQDQLKILDKDNRTAVDDFKERQGGAQVLEAIITKIENSQKEVGRLTS